MDKEIAKSLIILALSLGNPINQMRDLVEDISDEKIKSKFKEIIEYLMAYGTDIVLSIEEIYPELNPDLPSK